VITNDWPDWGPGHSCCSWSRLCARLARLGPAATTSTPREPIPDGFRRFSTHYWTTWRRQQTEIPHVSPRARARGRFAQVSPRRRQFRSGPLTGWSIPGRAAPASRARCPGLVPSLPRALPHHALFSASAASFTRPDFLPRSDCRPTCVGAVSSITGHLSGPRPSCIVLADLALAGVPACSDAANASPVRIHRLIATTSFSDGLFAPEVRSHELIAKRGGERSMCGFGHSALYIII
jgi:hypothetical protein